MGGRVEPPKPPSGYATGVNVPSNCSEGQACQVCSVAIRLRVRSLTVGPCRRSQVACSGSETSPDGQVGNIMCPSACSQRYKIVISKEEKQQIG